MEERREHHDLNFIAFILCLKWTESYGKSYQTERLDNWNIFIAIVQKIPEDVKLNSTT